MGQVNYVATIPSINIKKAIEIRGLALIGSEDHRYQSLLDKDSNLRKYLNSFTNPFGTKIIPSIVVRDSDLPRVEADHLTSFRNAIAIASVTYSRVKSYIFQRNVGVSTSEVFDFYPVSPGRDGQGLFSWTATELGIGDTVEKFRGQPSTVVLYTQNLRFE